MSTMMLAAPSVTADSVEETVAELAALARELVAYGVTSVPSGAEDAWQLLADLATSGTRCHAA